MIIHYINPKKIENRIPLTDHVSIFFGVLDDNLCTFTIIYPRLILVVVSSIRFIHSRVCQLGALGALGAHGHIGEPIRLLAQNTGCEVRQCFCRGTPQRLRQIHWFLMVRFMVFLYTSST